jgi:hypothetical protein
VKSILVFSKIFFDKMHLETLDPLKLDLQKHYKLDTFLY